MLLRLLVAAFGLGAATSASAEKAEPSQVTLVAADMRPHQSLDGAWHWSVDPYRDGKAGFHGGKPGSSSARYADVVQADVARRDPTALFEFDMQRSSTVQLPGAWIGHAPEMRFYNGLVWYQRTFDVTAPAVGKRTFLRFGAADYRADVYLNGKEVGSHVGGFTPFALEVTKLLRPGSNQITVGVDSERSRTDLPPPVTDWENYGGITRSVTLVTVPDTFIYDAWVRLTKDDKLLTSIQLDGPQAGGMHVQIRIPELGYDLDGTTDDRGYWGGLSDLPKGLKLWSPDSPKLYSVRFEAGDDALSDRIGFRTIEVRGDDILLNGKPIFLRGIAMHEEELGANPVRRITPAAAKALLRTIKKGLHGNFVRLAHYPHSEVMTRAADELGMLVWSEIPVYWQVDWNSEETLALARQVLRESILRDRNRASIVLWSVGNETPANEARNAFMRALVRQVRDLDDSRLVTAALLSGRNGKVQTIDDPLAADLDVMAVNTYNGWYSPDPLASLSGIEWRSTVKKPLIFSEFGAGAKAGYHDKAANPHKFSEEYQAEYYRQTLAMARKVPFLRGMSPWILGLPLAAPAASGFPAGLEPQRADLSGR
jgi:beta-glucuronidase